MTEIPRVWQSRRTGRTNHCFYTAKRATEEGFRIKQHGEGPTSGPFNEATGEEKNGKSNINRKHRAWGLRVPVANSSALQITPRRIIHEKARKKSPKQKGRDRRVWPSGPRTSETRRESKESPQGRASKNGKKKQPKKTDARNLLHRKSQHQPSCPPTNSQQPKREERERCRLSAGYLQ